MTHISCRFRHQKRNFSFLGQVYVFVLLSFCFNSINLNAEPVFQLHSLDKAQGMVSSVVYDIAQDRDGFMWFATEDGLQKYDGVKFVNYRHSRLDENSLSSNIVRNVLVDNQGRLWVGTEAGLNLYRKEFDDFERISLELKANQIRTLYQSSDNIIWIGSRSGLSSLDTKSRAIKNYPQARVRSIFEDDHKQLWIGTLGKGLFLFDRVYNSFTPIDSSSVISGKNSVEIKFSEVSVIDIHQDSYGRVLIATWGKGVHILDRDSRTLSQHKLKLPNLHVRSIHQDEKGQVWYGTNGGILISDVLNSKHRNIGTTGSVKGSLKSDKITKIYQGVDQAVWIATAGGGVSIHHPSSRKLEFYGSHRVLKHGLKDPVVYAMHETIRGDILIGTESGELVKFIPRLQEFKHIDLSKINRNRLGAIRAIHEVSDNFLLIGTSSGLYTYKPIEDELEIYRDVNGKEINVGEAVRVIVRDKKNRIWIVFGTSGIKALSKVRGNEKKLEVRHSIKLSYPQTLLNISEDKFLVGTQGNGIFEVDISKGKEVVRLLPLSEDINVLGLAYDWNQRLWAATWSKGIKIFPKNGQIISLDEEVGLPNNTVYSILPDRLSNKIWATSNAGMVAIEPESLSFTSYRAPDGVQGDEFNRPGFIAKNGYIYFGGVNGFNRFYPNIIDKKLYLYNSKLVKLEVANKEVSVSNSHETGLNRSLLVADEINLAFGQTPFSLEFTSPQFSKPSDIEFRYRLLGLEDSWINSAKDSRRATYTNIDPGEYVFQLQVRDINSEWNNVVERKKIIVHPPFWLTGLAKATYLLVVSAILAGFFYLYWRRRQAELLTQKTVEESEKRLRLSLWGGGNEIWDWNLISNEVLRSDEDKNISIQITTLSRDLREFASYIHKHDIDRVKRELQLHLSGKTEFFEATYRIRDEKLGWRWIQDRGKVVERDENDLPIRMSGTQRDVSEIQEKDDEIEILGQAFKTTSDGVWIRNDKWQLIECNPSYENMTGFTFTEKKGEELWFPDIPEQPVNVLQRIRMSLLEKGNWQGEVWAEKKNAEPFPQKLTVDAILDEKGHVRYYVGVFSDITFHKRTEEEFRRLANFDSLTGLPNRACLYDRLNQTINKARIRKERFALFVVDIDNFKRVNDSLGHNVGDALISEVANRLNACSNEADTIARIGGDEFVIIRDNIQSSIEVASFAELLLKELNNPVFVSAQKLNINYSIGITLSPDDGKSAELLLRNADAAMYEAKKDVMNSYHFYSVELNKRARKKLSMENALRKAVEEEQIDLLYQPKIDMRTGRVCGMEALARWEHSNYGNVDPDEFIPLAEETGLILPLGQQLLSKAISQTKIWVDQGIMRGRMSINLSAPQFWHRDLVSDVSILLKEKRLESKYLELELTESTCVQELEHTVEQMKELRELGVHLALDDFGTGYSSMAQLKTLPLDVLKVDKSFVQNIQNVSKDAKIVKAIIDIAHGLDIDVVIEGVESRKQCDYLWRSGAYVIQGYFFSKPVNYGDMSRVLDKTWKKSSYISNVGHNVTNINA